MLQTVIVGARQRTQPWRRRLATTSKARSRPLFYIGGIVLAFVDTRISTRFYVLVALMWLVPDRRIEKAIAER